MSFDRFPGGVGSGVSQPVFGGVGGGVGTGFGARRRSRGTRGGAAVRRTPHGRIELVSRQPRLTLRAYLDDGYPARQEGYGGWEDVERPGQVAATVFRGAPAQRIPIALILGSWPQPKEGKSCKEQIQDLERLARQPVGAARGSRPPLVTVRGPVPHAGDRYFVDDVEWGEVIVVDGEPARAHVTVTLKRYVPVRLVSGKPTRRSAAARRRHRLKRNERALDVVRQHLHRASAADVLAAAKQLEWGEGRRKGSRVRDHRALREGDLVLIPGEIET